MSPTECTVWEISSHSFMTLQDMTDTRKKAGLAWLTTSKHVEVAVHQPDFLVQTICLSRASGFVASALLVLKDNPFECGACSGMKMQAGASWKSDTAVSMWLVVVCKSPSSHIGGSIDHATDEIVEYSLIV